MSVPEAGMGESERETRNIDGRKYARVKSTMYCMAQS